MDALHHMSVEADNGDEMLLVCPIAECGRRVVVQRAGGLVVLDQGDFFAQHAGGSLRLTLSAATGTDDDADWLNAG